MVPPVCRRSVIALDLLHTYLLGYLESQTLKMGESYTTLIGF